MDIEKVRHLKTELNRALKNSFSNAQLRDLYRPMTNEHERRIGAGLVPFGMSQSQREGLQGAIVAEGWLTRAGRLADSIEAVKGLAAGNKKLEQLADFATKLKAQQERALKREGLAFDGHDHLTRIETEESNAEGKPFWVRHERGIVASLKRSSGEDAPEPSKHLPNLEGDHFLNKATKKFQKPWGTIDKKKATPE